MDCWLFAGTAITFDLRQMQHLFPVERNLQPAKKMLAHFDRLRLKT